MNNPIKSIRLQNFQSHQDTTVEPAPAGQLTVVTGPSDSGKTAIIRALKWALYNAPQGAEFTRTGASMVRVTMEFADLEVGKTVTVIRERTKATNRYKIVRPGVTEPEVFEGFGAGVPLEIQNITGVRPAKIADQEILLNLSEQLDPPFLGQKSISSPGRAKILGKLAGTEEIDVASTETGRDLYRRGQDEKRLEQDIRDLSARIEEFAWIEQLGAKIAMLENLVEKIRAAEARRSALEALKSRLLEVERQEADVRAVLKRWTVLPHVEATVNKVERAMERCRTVFNLGTKLKSVNEQINSNRQTLIQLKGIEVAEIAVNGATEKFARACTLHGLRIKLGQIEADINHQKIILRQPQVFHVEHVFGVVQKAEDAAVRAGTLAILKGRLAQIHDQEPKLIQTRVFYEQRIPELEREYFETLKQAKICPTCGQSVTELDETYLKEAM